MISSRALRLQNDLDAAVLLVAEHFVHLGSVLERSGVGDDKGRIDLSFFNPPQEIIRPAVDVGLAHAECQAFIHRLTHGDLVDEAAIDARDRDHACRAADIDHLAQNVRAVVLHHHHLLGGSSTVSGFDNETWLSMPVASMHFSGPLPPVSSFNRSTTLSSSKLRGIAPPASAMPRRSGR